MSDLPENWHELSVGTLWARLNDPRRRSTAQSTVEAIVYCVRERGLGALKKPANVERLSRCDDAATRQVNKRVEALLQRQERSR